MTGLQDGAERPDSESMINLSDLILPPGHRIVIEYEPDMPNMNVKIAAFRGEEFLAELKTRVSLIDRPGALQEAVDLVTHRGVHTTPELGLEP